ncbi:MAG: class I SAM-dependent methyltransferase [Rhodobacteraceae bacterium]|nr:class I SAM-dependent methyltransferase [Paracoccaceae bacterium]
MTQPPPVLLADPAPRAARLTLALAEGLVLPDGPLLVLRPRAGERFDPIPRDRLRMVQGFRPDHDALAAAGYSVAQAVDDRPAAAVMVCLPRAKAQALDLIAQAARHPGAQLVLVDGQKTDGIESVIKTLRAHVTIGGAVSKAHGKLFWFDPRGADLAALAANAVIITDPALGRFQTSAGVFSADGIDPGSRLLAQHLPDRLPESVVDLGAGWGYLAAAALARKGVAKLHLVEAEAEALALARANIPDPRAEFHWADATRFALPDAAGGVIINPPFHTGRKARPELGIAFIHAAARLLVPTGDLWLVANRHLPYADTLDGLFRDVDLLADAGGFRVWHAHGPKSARARQVARTGRTRR